MTKLTTVKQRFKIVWEDFAIADETLYNTEIFINELDLSDRLIDVALNFARYTGYDKKAYGISVDIDRGITEEESYNYWKTEIGKKRSFFTSQLKSLGVVSLPQTAFDGLFLHFWFTGKLTEVKALEGLYDLSNHILKKDWDMVASMIARCYEYKDQAIEAAKIIRLAFYTRTKSRRWLRQQGVFKMRDKNELYKFGTYTEEELRRARFAYYAETKNFLPYTPEGIKRDINNRYGETLIIDVYTWDNSTTVYELRKPPSLYPVEKLSVYVNGDILQHYYDYTINGTTVTFRDTSDFTSDAIIKFVIGI